MSEEKNEIAQLRADNLELHARVEAAEAVIREAREQKPVAWDRYDNDMFIGTTRKLPSGMYHKDRRYQPLYASPVPAPIHVTDEMAISFCNVLSDGSVGEEELNEIKMGIIAALECINLDVIKYEAKQSNKEKKYACYCGKVMANKRNHCCSDPDCIPY